jgi:hypothetical protein
VNRRPQPREEPYLRQSQISTKIWTLQWWWDVRRRIQVPSTVRVMGVLFQHIVSNFTCGFLMWRRRPFVLLIWGLTSWEFTWVFDLWNPTCKVRIYACRGHWILNINARTLAILPRMGLVGAYGPLKNSAHMGKWYKQLTYLPFVRWIFLWTVWIDTGSRMFHCWTPCRTGL